MACLCDGCLPKVHATEVGQAWMCDVCEWAPATVTCMVDAATLCYACDADIHSANPHATRHRRLPILPASRHCSAGSHSATAMDVNTHNALSGLLLHRHATPANFNSTAHNPAIRGISSEEYYYRFSDQFKYGRNDENANLLPVKDFWAAEKAQQNFQPDMGLGRPKVKPSYTALINDHMQSVSFPSYEGSSSTESRRARRRVDFFPGIPMPTFISMEREAKILKYREKRKKRNYGKTTRYPTRKADAETRPRVGGRFARITE